MSGLMFFGNLLVVAALVLAHFLGLPIFVREWADVMAEALVSVSYGALAFALFRRLPKLEARALLVLMYAYGILMSLKLCELQNLATHVT